MKQKFHQKRIFFIETTKDLIQKEGIDNLTVKKITDLVECVPANLYNYFESLNILLMYCFCDFLDECGQKIIKTKKNSRNYKEKIISRSITYVRYFVDNPNVYQLVLIENLGDPPQELYERVSSPLPIKLLEDDLKAFFKEKNLSKSKMFILRNLIFSFLNNNLTCYLSNKSFYVSNRPCKKKKDFFNIINQGINYLLTRNNHKIKL